VRGAVDISGVLGVNGAKGSNPPGSTDEDEAGPLASDHWAEQPRQSQEFEKW
jgi:hypothetical protein